jgi:hypothetical protein
MSYDGGGGGPGTLQETVNLGNAISNFGTAPATQATISSTNFMSNRTLTLNGDAQPTIYMVDNLDASKQLEIDTETLYVNSVGYSWDSIVTSSKPNAYGIATYAIVPNITWIIPITGLTASGLVMVTFVHPGILGANHYIKSLTPGTDNLTITLSQNFAVGDSIIWNVLKFA